MGLTEQTVATRFPSDRAAEQHVEAVVAASGSSFFWAMRLLPAHKRRAVYAVYAFCRDVDDIADGAGSSEAKLRALEAWREEIARLYDGQPTRPITLALQPAIERFSLARADFEAIIDGMERDAAVPLLAPSMVELERYCDQVAGAPGRLCVAIFGDAGCAGLRAARSLGLALQLTNILRDLREDAELGRLYLPAELLSSAGIDTCEPAAVVAHPALPTVCRALAAKAERAFGEAEATMATCSREAMRPAVVMMMVYRRMLERMTRRGWGDLEALSPSGRLERVTDRIGKLWLALRYGILAR